MHRSWRALIVVVTLFGLASSPAPSRAFDDCPPVPGELSCPQTDGGAQLIEDSFADELPSTPGEPSDAQQESDQLPEETSDEPFDPEASDPEAIDEPAAEEPAQFDPPGASAAVQSSDAGPQPARSKPVRPKAPQPPEPDSALGQPAACAPLEFDGVQPGRSTVADAQRVWGDPTAASDQAGRVLHAYTREPFERIEVTFEAREVISIAVTLREHFPPETIASQLGIDDLRPVPVVAASGGPIGQAYPECGVLLRFAAARPGKPGVAPAPKVSQVIMHVIDPGLFVERAWASFEHDDTACLNDLATAIELDAGCAAAWGLRSTVLANLGHSDQALQAAEQALEHQPDDPQLQLCRARALADAARFDEAIAATQEVLKQTGLEAHVHARGLAQLGDQLAAGPDRDYEQALEYHLQAIRVAEPLGGSRQPAVRISAKRTLILAHLAVAQDVAWGNWQQKEQAVEKWLARARSLCQQAIAADGLAADYLLRVEAASLAAAAGTQGTIDPAPLARQALQVGRQVIDQAADPLRRRRLERQLGLAMYDALQAFQARGQHDEALEHGGLAVAWLEEGIESRPPAPSDSYLLGRLYFRLGSIHAQSRQQHQEAIAWYEKAIPLLEKPIPDSALGDSGRQGETLVTAALSYWSEGDRDKAVQLTSHGVELMEQAVDQGMLPAESLSVGYANLATMHGELGNQQEARDYTLRASRIAASDEGQDR